MPKKKREKETGHAPPELPLRDAAPTMATTSSTSSHQVVVLVLESMSVQVQQNVDGSGGTIQISFLPAP